MLDAKINAEECMFKISISGTLPDILTDLTYLTSVIYERLCDKDLMDMFDSVLKGMVNDGLYKTHIKLNETEKEKKSDDEDLEKLIKKILKELKEE